MQKMRNKEDILIWGGIGIYIIGGILKIILQRMGIKEELEVVNRFVRFLNKDLIQAKRIESAGVA